MSERLTWDEIKKRYKDEWVELIEFEWDETRPYPESGVVGIHSTNRRGFDRTLIEQRENRPRSTAILYTGRALKLPKNYVFNASLRQYGQVSVKAID